MRQANAEDVRGAADAAAAAAADGQRLEQRVHTLEETVAGAPGHKQMALPSNTLALLSHMMCPCKQCSLAYGTLS